MRALAISVALGFGAFTPALTAVVPRSGNATGSIPLPSRQLYHWPNGTWVENIAVRPNGNLLLTTSTPNGTVWQVKEPWSDAPEVELAYNFDEWVDRLIGIGETTPDKYIVVGSRFYAPEAWSSQVARTFCAMELDYSNASASAPSARLVAWFPEASLLQSVAALPWDRTTVLISDQYLMRPRKNQLDWTPSPGRIWRLDTKTGEYEVVLTGRAELDTTYVQGYDVGINGIKIRGSTLYWINQDTGGVYSVEIDESGRPTGEIETIAIVDTFWDDFALMPTNADAEPDTIWATGMDNVWAVNIENSSAIVVTGVGTTDNTSFPGPTAAQFGRTAHDDQVLYVTGNLYDVPATLLDANLGGWVRAIDTTGFCF